VTGAQSKRSVNYGTKNFKIDMPDAALTARGAAKEANGLSPREKS
jgi:hypothetical protein